MHPAHPSTMMVVDDNMMRTFPIIQIEVKIRVPDQLIGRLIGKNGVCLKKIMEETTTHISITEARQYETQNYQTPELYDRIITIRGTNWNTVIMAEKNVQQKLRQFIEQDMNMNVGGGQQYYHGPGVIMNPVENIGPYIPPGSVPAQMLQRDNTYAAANAYNALPLGVSPQSFYIQNPAAAVAANYSIPSGQFGHNAATMQAAMPNSVHIKSRVYVPNQIVGILIGTRGQTIKSIIAESGALISIEGDHPKKVKKEVQNENNKPESSSNNEFDHVQQQTPNSHKAPFSNVVDGNGLDMKSMAKVEQIADEKNGEPEKKIDGSGNEASNNNTTTTADEQPQNLDTEGGGEEGQQKGSTTNEEEKQMADQNNQSSQEEVNSSQQQQHNPTMTPNAQNECHHQFNGNKQRNHANNHNQLAPISPDLRGVFVQGYDFQVYKALYWVYQKVADVQNMRPDEIVLTCEAIVPSKVIGRIIGKQGQNVKQLQQRTGAQIKVPDDVNQNDKVDAAVRVVGSFGAVQMVQQHFGTLIMDAEWRESREYDERERRSRNYREGSR